MNTCFLAIILACAATIYTLAPKEVIHLHDKDVLQDALEDYKFLFINFFKDTNDECRFLAPHFEKLAPLAAKKVAIADLHIGRGKNDLLARVYGVTRVPTLKLFKDGKFLRTYTGTLDTNSMLDWLRRRVRPSPREVTTNEQFDSFKNITLGEKRTLVLGIFQNNTSQQYRKFVQIASNETNDDDFDFFVAVKPDQQLLKAQGIEDIGNDVVVLHSFFEDPINTANFETLQPFISKYGLPLIDILDERTRRRFEKPKTPMVMLYFNITDNEMVMKTVKELKPVMEEFRDNFFFGYCDININRHTLEQMGGNIQTIPSLTAFIPVGGKKYPFYLNRITAPEVKRWLQLVANDEIQSFIYSEPIPQEKTPTGITKIVGKNFHEVVMNERNDILIEFYTQGNEIHERFQIEYKHLAQKVANIPNIVIAQIDMGRNDVPISVNPPNLVLFASHKKKTPLNYQGDGSVGDILKFLSEETVASKSSITKLLKSENKRKDEL
jgi:protein disulfide isomerase